MLIRILGYIWIIAGILFLIKPQILKNKLQRKSLRKMKKYFIFLALFLGIVLISVGIKFEGGLAKIIMIIGIISVIKGVFLIKGKAAEKMLVLGERMPLMYFRIGGLAYIAIGVIILLLR